MQDVIFDTLPPLNSNLAKNSFLAACPSPSADMLVACPSFMTIIRQFQNNFSQSASIQNVLEDGLSEMSCCQAENGFLIGFGRGFYLQASLQGKDWDED